VTDGAPVRAPSFRRELARKAIHLSSAAVPVFLALRGDHTFAVLVLGILAAIAVLVEVARATSPLVEARFEMLFRPLLRVHESRHLTGATWLLGAMFGAVLLFPRNVAIAATWAAAVGDTAAALVGMRFGRHRSRRDGKSMEGSVACLLATFAGALLLARFDIVSALLVAVSAAVAERLPWPRDDNMRIIAVVGVTALIAAALR
jgi:dolichol kinase